MRGLWIHIMVIEVFYRELDTPFHQGHSTSGALKPDFASREAKYYLC